MGELVRKIVEEGSPLSPPVIVHHMRYGFTACSQDDAGMREMPSFWPLNHFWTTGGDWDSVNCPGCLKYRSPAVPGGTHPERP